MKSVEDKNEEKMFGRTPLSVAYLNMLDLKKCLSNA